ncbi:MAG: uncharacterized protein JWM25_68 [Thermoleophilia bacterium]|nr:uncharacterized protein [Thermoleophilia bacterium]
MKPSKRTILIGTVCAALGSLGGGYALAAGGSEDATEGPETAITGSALEEASAVALDEVGSGTVTGTEIDDEEGKYEVEVTHDDGTQVDVHLDADFSVVGTEADGNERGENDES